MQIRREMFKLERLELHAHLRSSSETLLPAVNHDRFAENAFARTSLGDRMTINAAEARIEWAARLARQSREMTIIAGATSNMRMREELLGFADRLNEQLATIRALPPTEAHRPQGVPLRA